MAVDAAFACSKDPGGIPPAAAGVVPPAFAEIPEDSDASIQTQGLLGGKYIGIGPGGSDTYLKDGSQIEFTQSAIVLESLVNKFFANLASKGPDNAGTAQNATQDKEPKK